MCGIAGIVERVKGRCEPAFLHRMNGAVVHRGPDDGGEHFWQNVALGHRRLAIIDLSECGHQPMSSSDGALVIVFNGEIYNYVELRAELEKAGQSFRSRTDTEVIVASYAVWGTDCVSRFNGMWAFALLDKKQRRIFCSRDRFGVKPFYYTESPERFAFGSEIRQLLPFLPTRESSRSLVSDFLLTGVCDHTEQTFFEGIRKLPPGHNLSYDLVSNRFKISRYYKIAPSSALSSAGPEEAVAVFGSMLESSVDLRLRSDVPVGTCLSGGLDSSSIASLASPLYRRRAGRAFRSITAVSEQDSNDESAFASKVAAAGGMEWFTVKPSYDDFVEVLPSVVKAQEEPFGGPSVVMQFFVMKTAREQRIPVMLDGQGGDETLLGYTKYYASQLLATWKEKGLLALLGAHAMAGRNNAEMSLWNSAKYLLTGLSPGLRHRLYAWRHRYLISTPPIPQHFRDLCRSASDCLALQKLEITSTHLPVLLRYEDKNSMAHSIEARLPFLDYRVVETALSLPRDVKIRDGWSKWVLRKFMSGRMPDEVTWRKNKMGFEAPEKTWLDRHSNTMKEVIAGSAVIREIVDFGKLDSLWPSLDYRSRWRLYSVALWEDAFDVAA
jgi:asparagine synthase (glutamine-hydrolysing)